MNPEIPSEVVASASDALKKAVDLRYPDEFAGFLDKHLTALQGLGSRVASISPVFARFLSQCISAQGQDIERATIKALAELAAQALDEIRCALTQVPVVRRPPEEAIAAMRATLRDAFVALDAYYDLPSATYRDGGETSQKTVLPTGLMARLSRNYMPYMKNYVETYEIRDPQSWEDDEGVPANSNRFCFLLFAIYQYLIADAKSNEILASMTDGLDENHWKGIFDVDIAAMEQKLETLRQPHAIAETVRDDMSTTLEQHKN